MPKPIRDRGEALAYVVDCTLATVTDLASKKSAPKGELSRQIGIAQKGINWMIEFGVDYSHTRAQEVVDKGGSVSDWAEQFRPRAGSNMRQRPMTGR